jgi:uncharacterized protein DUF4390
VRSGLLASLLAAAALAGAEPPDPRVRDVTTSFAGRELRVSARLDPELPAELERRLAAGLPASVTWRIGLFAHRPVWWDGKKGERRYEVTATYRPDSDDVTVERRLDGRLLETDVVRTRAEASRALSRVGALPAFTMGRHLDGKRLVVKVACRYGTNVSLGVVPSDAETDWKRSPVFVWREP